MKNKPLGQLLSNVSLKDFNSWRVGGVAEFLYLPDGVDTLATFLKTRPLDEKITWLGLGSNVLVREGGVAGLVIVTHPGLARMGWVGDGMLRVEAGVPCPKIARFCTKNGWVGAEFLAGIPGTFGGALAMNAGAFGGETWDLVRKVESLSREGVKREREQSEFSVGYRSVKGPVGEWFAAGTIALRRGDATASFARIKVMLDHRAQTQPTRLLNCGSVFRNPPGDFAARLIETAGLKGLREGNAVVSEKHANFIVNEGGARAADIETLIQKVLRIVKQKHGIELVTEVRVVG